MLKECVLIVAGGKGMRMHHKHPKPFLKLFDKPILLHTINAFYQYSKNIDIVLVLGKDHLNRWADLCEKYPAMRTIQIQQGGPTRFQSVKNGLTKIDGDGLVAIHDGVRPLVRPETIATSFHMANTHRTAVATTPLKDSIRKTSQHGTQTVNRAHYQLVQTPQTFDIKLIKSAYEHETDSDANDDASVAERAGHTIYTFAGRYDIIKITTAEDLAIAEALLLARNQER